jgi:hypothetical protein
VLLYSARVHIVTAVATGQPVKEAAWVELAHAYANRQLHRCRTLTLLALALAAFVTVTAAFVGPSIGDLGAICGALGILATSAPGWRRAHRFLREM